MSYSTDQLSKIIDYDEFQERKQGLKQKSTKVHTVGKSIEREPFKIATPEEKEKLRQEALAIYETLSAELDVFVPVDYKKPNTWSYYSVSELERGDALQVGNVIYIYVKKLAWWRNKTANVLVAQTYDPSKQKRVGELDYVLGFRGYVRHQQMERMGINMNGLGI